MSRGGWVRSMVRDVSAAVRPVFCAWRSGCVAQPASTSTIDTMNSRRQFMRALLKVVFPFTQAGKDVDFRGERLPGMARGTLRHGRLRRAQERVGGPFEC